MTKAERAEMNCQYLREETYIPRIDSEGDVVFTGEGKTYTILIDPEDEAFFSITLFDIWSINNDAERVRVEQAALHATATTKVTKIWPTKDNTIACVELFCVPPESFKSVFEHAMRALQRGLTRFRNAMYDTRPETE
jgi:hypothetical protein